MIRQKILQQLLEWIECNLEHPISIEDIAQKSGYSRRNIQLLFRNFMHVPLGEYIRKRRLCRAAILVRLSAKSMLDIALSFCILIHSSHSAANLKVIRLLSP